ncbi:hypothetical protein FOTG_17972 [Fusarium oxysporum f. sp. vasinfectum 25433]|uniref:PiggyBac transposable element-derived protein domain-containing protein n=1 Tax=Fusarium oxysporum f. sp. vasinfectum 25433 TaxID=1089449 RepID=X0KXR9_FUSOX|nr:hypothetical protein FOTG_17972 [Fusarium oxysporum f. sp. vasinfectum 25433]
MPLMKSGLSRPRIVNQIAWKDNSPVLFTTTVFRGDERTDKKRQKPSTDHLRARPIQLYFGEETTQVVPILTVAYDDKVNHVD